MGFEGVEGRAQFHSELSAFRSWDKSSAYDQEHALKNKPILAALAAGSTTYTSATDPDLQSIYSDDTVSVADSVFDNASVASSQSSYGSSGSDSSEDSSDGEHVPTTRTRQLPVSKDAQKKFEPHPELLSGLGPESLPMRFNFNRGPDAQDSTDHAQHTGPINRHLNQADALRPEPQAQQQTTFKQPPSAPQKTNRRRSVSSETSAPPCRLKRDTESADCFVMMLISKCTRLALPSPLFLTVHQPLLPSSSPLYGHCQHAHL